MPLLVLGFAALIASVVGFALNAVDTDRQHRKLLPASPMAAATGGEPVRPPQAYRGDAVFCLRQQRWGRVETLAHAARGYVYGVRLLNGLGVVARDADIIK